MIRNLRALGIAFVAVFAMSAVAASAAHATAAHFRCGTTGTLSCNITVEQDPNKPTQLFKTHAGNVSCQKFHAIGPFSGTGPEITLTELEYKECELAGLAATVTVPKGCHYTLTSGETEAEPEKSTGNVTLAVTAGESCKIEIKTLKCTVTVNGPQTFKNAVTYENVKTTHEEITGHATVNSIEYTTAATCPGGAGTFKDGVYEGTFTAKAFETSGPQTELTLVDTP